MSNITTTLPGIKAAHANITTNCQEVHGSKGAFDEAVERLREEYSAITTARDDQYNIHLVLTVETVG